MSIGGKTELNIGVNWDWKSDRYGRISLYPIQLWMTEADVGLKLFSFGRDAYRSRTLLYIRIAYVYTFRQPGKRWVFGFGLLWFRSWGNES